MTRIFFTLLLIGLLGACKTPKATQGSDAVSTIPMTAVKQADYCGVEGQELKVIQDAAAWEALWSKMTSITMPAPPVPKVDFSKQLVVAYFLGTQNYGGHKVEFKQISLQADVLQVDVVHTSAGSNCITTSALTQPYCVVTIAKIAHSSAKASVEEVVNDC